MRKKVAAGVVALSLLGFHVFAGEPRGFTATVDIDANALLIRKKAYENGGSRQYANSLTTTENLPFGGFDLLTDTAVSFSYEGAGYGGNLSLDDKDGIGGIKVWVRLAGGMFKITAGDDIGAGYADSLDADPGMRVYTGATPAEWDASKDPDNITQDKGLLLEAFPGNFTLAFAGQYFDGSALSLDVNSAAMEHSKWENVGQKSYGYGARVGYQLGEWGKVNVSYVNQYSNVGGNNYRVTSSGELVPVFADSERTVHMFGVYASLTPPVRGLAVTLGYDGVYTRYLDEFYQGIGWIKTLTPKVYQSAVNLNARYKGVDKLTLRTDHNYSFWTDRDYRPFAIGGKGNYGLESTVEGEALANVEHALLWNGLGASYQFTDVFKLGVYLRNLHRRDTAGDQSDGRMWEVRWNKAVAETTATFTINASVELYAGITVENTSHYSSKDVNAQIPDFFVSWVSAPFETKDTELVFKIPVGITMKLQP
jgi:hypothetical protein